MKELSVIVSKIYNNSRNNLVNLIEVIKGDISFYNEEKEICKYEEKFNGSRQNS